MSSGTWYVRQYGKVQGPYSWDQIRAMKAQGQLGSFSELSPDQRTWTGIARYPEFNPPPVLKRRPAATAATRTQPGGRTVMGVPVQPVAPEPLEPLESLDDTLEPLDSLPDARPQPAAPASSSFWYYAVDEQQYGPVPLVQVLQMLERGELLATDMVWEQGSPDWLPIAEVPQLGGKAPLPPWAFPAACAALVVFGIILIIIVWTW